MTTPQRSKPSRVGKAVTTASLIADINKRLDGIEDLSMWLVRAPDRFKVGQRVRFNALAIRRKIPSRKPGTGTVEKVSDTFSIRVLLDGYKHTKGFHHGFFEPAPRKKKGASRGK